jgi:hypothetical protein
MGLLALVLLACAVLLVLAAEWSRLSGRFEGLRSERSRARRRRRLTVVEGGEGDEDFAASVERDLANLPVLDQRDDQRR